MAAKYVTGLLIANGGAVRALAVVFPEYFEHREIAQRTFKGRGCVVSAGFVTFQNDRFEGKITAQVHGESVGLGLTPNRAADEFLIEEALGIVHRDRGDPMPDDARPGNMIRYIMKTIPDFTADDIL